MMFLWLILIIVAYLFFSFSFFGDKLVLNGPINPKLYTFYVGMLNIIVIIFIPFSKLTIPNGPTLIWALLDAVAVTLGVYSMFIALEKSDASRVMPTIGATQPLFIVFILWAFWGGHIMTPLNFLAFGLLLAGTAVISIEGKVKMPRKYFLLILFSSLLFSLDYIFTKLVFLNQPFLEGLIWMRAFTFLFSLLFLFDGKLRKQIFTKKTILNGKNSVLLLVTQGCAGIAGLFQSLAIFLAPVSYLAIINSLRGVQYIFLFLMTLFFSIFFPKILKEDISKKIIIQKLVSIALIMVGLAILISY